MTKAKLATTAVAISLALVAFAAAYRALGRSDDGVADRAPAAAATVPTASAADAAPPPPAPPSQQGFLYGRVTTVDGATYEGRLRWGRRGSEEAFWSDSFNGIRPQNPWLAHVPPERRPRETEPVEIFGIAIGARRTESRAGRLFMVRFGEITRLEASGKQVQVTLKSGDVVVLDRMDANDFDDGLRVWDAARGAVDLKSVRIRRVDFLPTRALRDAPSPLHGTVRTRHGDFTGLVGWNRLARVGGDELVGRTGDGEVGFPFAAVRSIERRSDEVSRVTLHDGRAVELAGAHEVGDGNRPGIHVDDPRFGRALISWDVFASLDLTPGGAGAAYDDFPPGRPLRGTVTTREGRRLAGRLVYDLEEAATGDTLDVSSAGIDYTLPFSLVASIVLAGEAGGRKGNAAEGDGGQGAPPVTVGLHGGEELRLERRGDLRPENAGLLVFVGGARRAEHVPWDEVSRIDLEPSPPPARVGACGSDGKRATSTSASTVG